MKGTTRTGFAFEVDENAFNDMEVVDVLSSEEMDATYKMSFLVNRMLGAKQKKALYDHLRDASGRVPVDAVEREMEDIFAAFGQQGKNS
ncbi:MAG: hypothetical protein PUD70_03140 [Firmicutes bacterium]|nr:hypothetical protein [Bacillota bacterium]